MDVSRRLYAVFCLLALLPTVACGGGSTPAPVGGVGDVGPSQPPPEAPPELPPAPPPAPLPPAQPVIDIAIGERGPSAGGPDGTRVLLFYDVLAKGPNAPPDVVLEGTVTGTDLTRSVVIADRRLFIAGRRNNEIAIYDHYTHLISGQGPNIVLDEVGSSITTPMDMKVHRGDLYVAQRGSTSGILIFRDHTMLTSGKAPDVVLPVSDRPMDIHVDDDALYVATLGAGSVLVFDDPASLVNGSTPTVVLESTSSGTGYSRGVSVDNGVLYVSCRYPGRVVAFRLAGLQSGQAPDFVLGTGEEIQSPKEVVIAENRLFVADRGLYAMSDHGLAIYDNPSMLVTGAMPSVLLGSGDVINLHNVAVAGGMLWGVTGNGTLAPGLFGFASPGSIHDSSAPEIAFTNLGIGRPGCMTAVER